ncbi:MAG: hypothetical protein IKG17_10580 [Mogibacterium sp.]|jgi:ABC-type transport system involved in cytochrome bd biosynthesis fused ATPase/permease subunit|nr:hypothetical protein [Mogibacterium sp.]
MTGREVILTNRSFTPQELYEFMEEYWDKEEYNDFVLGSPTDMSVGMYVMLPATARHLVIVYSRDKGFLNKEKKVVLSVAMTSAGAAEAMARSIPTGGRVIAGIVKLHSVKSQNEDRTGPAQEALVAYTNYMRTLLGEAGYLK